MAKTCAQREKPLLFFQRLGLGNCPKWGRLTARLAIACAVLTTCLWTRQCLVAGEVLYNGIELADQWPPRRTLQELRAGQAQP